MRCPNLPRRLQKWGFVFYYYYFRDVIFIRTVMQWNSVKELVGFNEMASECDNEETADIVETETAKFGVLAVRGLHTKSIETKFGTQHRGLLKHTKFCFHL